MVDIEHSIWNTFKHKGLKVFAIGGEDEAQKELSLYIHQMGLSLPVLYDEDMKVQAEHFRLEMAIQSQYPKDFIIGVDGNISYVNKKYDSEEVAAVIEQELVKLQLSERKNQSRQEKGRHGAGSKDRWQDGR